MTASIADGGTILLLTGRSGVGKSTLLGRVADALEGHELRGFTSQLITEGGERAGWRLDGLTTAGGVFAHRDLASGHVNRGFGLDLALLDRLAAELRPNPAVDAYLVDEIGPFASLSAVFAEAVITLLGSGAIVVATVHRWADGLPRQVREWPGAKLVEVTEENREGLVDEIVGWVTRTKAR